MQVNCYFALIYIVSAFFIGICTGRFLGVWRTRPAVGSSAAGEGQRVVPSDGGDSESVPLGRCESKLKPCPFCGGDVNIERGEEGGYYASCVECFVVVGEAFGHSNSAMGWCNYGLFEHASDAIKAWNMRVDVGNE